MRTGEPVVTTDAQDDPRFAEQHSIISFNLRSILCVPLITENETTGWLYTELSGIYGRFNHEAAFAHGENSYPSLVSGISRCTVTITPAIAPTVFAA